MLHELDSESRLDPSRLHMPDSEGSSRNLRELDWIGLVELRRKLTAQSEDRDEPANEAPEAQESDEEARCGRSECFPGRCARRASRDDPEGLTGRLRLGGVVQGETVAGVLLHAMRHDRLYLS